MPLPQLISNIRTKTDEPLSWLIVPVQTFQRPRIYLNLYKHVTRTATSKKSNILYVCFETQTVHITNIR